jgi:hypothetical protein
MDGDNHLVVAGHRFAALLRIVSGREHGQHHRAGDEANWHVATAPARSAVPATWR